MVSCSCYPEVPQGSKFLEPFHIFEKFLYTHSPQLLKAISIALPFLVVRTVYSVLSTFSSSTFSVTATTPNDSSLARFNIVTGEWQIYLVMDMLMEYAVVIIYTVAGLMLPLDRDYKFPDYNHEQYPLSGSS